MSYIGKTPTIGNFQVCDAISVVNGQAAYTMQVNSVNVVPESANHMLVSLNGILQKPGGSFTVSGSTITFASNLSTGDVIDFITLLGNVLDLGTPSDATVTNAKTNFVSTSSAAGLQIKGDGTTDGTLQLNCSQNSHGIKLKSPPHSASASYTLTFPNNDGDANQFLKTDGSGVLSFAAGGGITVADWWRLSASTTVPTSATDMTSNWERVDAPTGFGLIGSAMTLSSGVFTFPETGFYLITIKMGGSTAGGATQYVGNKILTTHDNSTYVTATDGFVGTGGNQYYTVINQYLFDVSSTSTHKVKFSYYTEDNASADGATNQNVTYASFIKLGDT